MMRRSTLTSNNHLDYNLKTTKKWRHIGYTYDNNTGNQRLYVDGTKVRESVIAKQEIATDYKVRIGGAKVGDSRIFKGRISCVQFYDKALTAKQVLAIMNRCQERNEVYSACLQNKLLKDHSRSVEYDVVSGNPSDRETFIRRRWYRLQNKKAARIVTSCPAPGSCGAKAPGWLNGQYPALEAGIKKMEICYRTGADCCGRNATVYVRQCYGYPVFMFDDVPEKSLGNRVCIEPALIQICSKRFQITNNYNDRVMVDCELKMAPHGCRS
ncbi:Uromodulin [Exaiptasia diaphana]|nr:Uromodulin [Exaiptasia diaphana]